MKVSEAIKGYIIDVRTRGRKEGTTIRWYEQKLGKFAVWLSEEEEIERLDQVTTTHLRSFMLYIQSLQPDRVSSKDRGPSQLSPLTVKGYAQVIKGFFTWCYDEELIEKNPSQRLKLPSVPDYIIPTFTPDHIKLMLDVCNISTTLGYRDYTIILVLLETGVRVSELCGLQVQDVHDDYIKVLGKGSKEREVGLSPDVAKLLWKYIHHYRRSHSDSEKRVFMNRYGKPLTPNGIEQLLIDIKNRAGITGVRVSAHTFRHTFARMYLEQGGEIYKLSRLMGHSDIEVTQEYLKDFNNRAARQDQERFSVVGTLGLLKKKRGGPKRS